MEENIKAALEYAVALKDSQKVLHDIDGKKYYDQSKGTLRELEPIKYAETLKVNTLSSLVSFLKDWFKDPVVNDSKGSSIHKLLIHVESPERVDVLSQLDADRNRESLIAAVTNMDQFPYKRFMDSEKFIINVQSLIQREDDAEAILACASAIRIEGGADLTDNGVSQIATVKAGAATVEQAEVPSPAELRPYRTFLEVEQPKSPFVFRINEDGGCALFEADGGMWKNFAMDSIKDYLEDELQNEIEAGCLSVIA